MTQKYPDFLRIRVGFWGLVTVAGVLASLATLFGFLGALWWFLDLFAHFRVQYFLGLCAVSLLLLISKKRKLSACFCAAAIVNLITILPFYFGVSGNGTNSPVSVRALLINVNSKSGDPEKLARVIQEYNPDLILLEEVNSEWIDQLKRIIESYPFSEVKPRDDNFGIALYSKLPFIQSSIVYMGGASVPSVLAKVDTPNGTITIIGTHPLPPAGANYSKARNNQLDSIPSYVANATSPVLVLGDLNVSPWSYHFKRLLRRADLKNSSRGRGIQPTWPTFNPLLRIPIDHCLYSDGIKVIRKEIGPHISSDHYPIIVDFTLTSQN